MLATWSIALGICAFAVIFEALCAGKDPMGELRKLRQPSWSPPNWLWVMIGIAWYCICLVGLVRLLPSFDAGPAPVMLLVGLMLANGAVNLFQFRMRRLDLALAFFGPYWLLLAAFLWVVWPLDPIVGSLFAVYAVYQLYAAAWGYALWKLNRSVT